MPEIPLCDGITASNNHEVLVYINASAKDKINTVIHESVHVFQRICMMIGESEPSDEFAAYTVAHIATTFLKELVSKE